MQKDGPRLEDLAGKIQVRPMPSWRSVFTQAQASRESFCFIFVGFLDFDEILLKETLRSLSENVKLSTYTYAV